MRSLIVKIIATMVSFYATSSLVAGFQIEPTWQSYLLSAIIFLLFNLLVTPLIKLLLLPINLLTLGLFRWITQVIVIYLFDVLYTGITISPYYFGGYSSSLLALPAANITAFWVYCLSALVMSLSYNLAHSLLLGDNS
jgi:putative membrane protein